MWIHTHVKVGFMGLLYSAAQDRDTHSPFGQPTLALQQISPPSDTMISMLGL